MNTSEYIQKLAAHKVAVAIGEMEVEKTRSVGKKVDDPKPAQKSFIERAADKFLPEMAGGSIGYLAHGMEEYGNYKYNQSTPIGELFSDFANNTLKKKGLEGDIYYTQTFPRSPLINLHKDESDLTKILKSFISPKTQSISAYGDRVLGNSEEDKELIKHIFSEPFAKNMIDDLGNPERLGELPDRLRKAMKNGDDWWGDVSRYINNETKKGKNRGMAFMEALSNQASNTEPFSNARGMVKTPRNNMRALAHEYGHIESEMGVDNIKKTKIGPVYDVLRKVLSDPINGLHESYSPDFLKNIVGKISGGLNSTPTGNIINRSLQTVSGVNNSLPTQTVFLTKALGTISPDTLNNLKEKDPTGILDYIDEHPIASTLIASLPHVGREAATTIPGTRMTYEFWKALKDGNNEFMKNHVFSDEVRKGIKNLADINPGWEAAKFFGKNLGKTTISLTAPVLGLMAFNKVKEWLGQKDDS